MASFKPFLGIFGSLSKYTSYSWKCLNLKLTSIPSQITQLRSIQTTSTKFDLMDFFDNKKNWGEDDIQVGRSWKLDELRIKSNSDLHKLWFVLLKERNMLYTMEHECKESIRLFPNPERIDKVQESMVNLETVVRERNTAYHLLETGETGERPSKLVPNQLGVKFQYKMFQHMVPRWMNTKWAQSHVHRYGGCAVKKFLLHYREQRMSINRKARNRDFNHVQHLIKYFPNMDMAKLKAQYPNVDIERAKRYKKSRGHYIIE